MADPLFWEKVAALGQVAGAVATFAAVVVSLWLALTERRPRLKLTVSVWSFIGGGWNEDVIGFNVINKGSRAAKIVGYGWETGWLRRRHMVINHNAEHPYQPPLPSVIAPGDKLMFLNDIEVFLSELERLPEEFTIRLPWIGRVPRRVRGHIYLASGESFKAPVSRHLRRLIRTRDASAFAGARIQRSREGKNRG